MTDRSTDGWRVVRPDREGRPTHDRLGEAALYAMFWYQSFYTDHESPIIPCEAAYRTPNSRTLVDYSHPITAGWDGDALLPYAAAGETGAESVTAVPRGYVWKLAWDRPADARTFADAYRELLSIHGASRVSNSTDTYRIPETSGFAGVTSLRVTNATVLVVKGPSVEAVREIRPGAVPDAVSADAGQDDTTGVRGPGLGVVAVLVGLATVAALAVLARRRR
ncbi:hypothetical protein BRD09_00770 [Halobacteriales archaeon SW_10_68_16]|nr:MAG: hypothetical protein BRD09_00770 [Halobacteriales archaeon SW_10_68_16]